MRVNSLAQENNAELEPGLEPGPLDPELSALTFGKSAPPTTTLSGTAEHFFRWGG